MYGDNTTLFCNIDNNVTDDVINRDLFKIYHWLGANKLALNVSKTKFMVFHTRNKSVKYPSLLKHATSQPQTIDDLFAKELRKKRKHSPTSTCTNGDKRVQCDDAIK